MTSGLQCLCWLMLCVPGLLAGACTETSSPPLRLGTNVWPGYEPLYLARDLGYVNAQALKLVEYLSASEVMRAFRNRALDAAALTLDEVLVLRQQRVPVQVVLVTDISHGADVIVGGPSVHRVADLTGKRVGVETSAVGAYVLTRALERADLVLGDVTVVSLEMGEHVAAYKAGKVDALVTFEPARTHLLTLGARELFSSRDLPGEIVDVVVVHQDYLAAHAETVRQVVRGWFQALEYLEHHPREAARRMHKRLRLSPEELLRSYEGLKLPGRVDNLTLLGGEVPQLLSAVRGLQAMMLTRQLLQAPVNLEQLFVPLALP